MYFSVDSRYQLSVDASFHEKAHAKHRIRSDIQSHVLQIDFTSYLKSIDHRISIRSFLQSSHRCIIWFKNLLRWKSLFENFKQCIVEKTPEVISLRKFISNDSQSFLFFNRSKIYRVEEICSKILSTRMRIAEKVSEFVVERTEICIVEKACTKVSNWSRYLL